VPWPWTRWKVAQAWHCKPWEVDEAMDEGRSDEVALTIKLLNLESEYQRRPD